MYIRHCEARSAEAISKMKNNRKIIIIFFILLSLIGSLCVAAVTYYKSFTFNNSNAFTEWKERILNGKVRYTLGNYVGLNCIHAQSIKSCSALYNSASFDIWQYPIVSWKWKVVKFPQKDKVGSKVDDYAARFYIVFLGYSFGSSKFLEYIWDEKIQDGIVQDSIYGKNIKQFFVRRGQAEEVWVEQTRNIYNDYQMAFGVKPPRKANIVALMCDSDNSASEAEALFTDIKISSGP